MLNGEYNVEDSLPDYLKESLERYRVGLRKYETDPSYTVFDCDFLEFQSDINICESDGTISSEIAWYLRDKYLGLSREENGG